MKKALALFAGMIAFGLSFAQPAYAQATRTWVSGVGDDVNPCSRTAPCKTFAGAISKTAAGGEINCLDPGGFGAVTITKSITIDCTGTFGSILHSAVNGININDSATATPNTINVVIRGLTINGAGTTLGLNGINFTSGRSLVLEDVFFQNVSGRAINLRPGGSIRVAISNVTMANVAGGVLVQPTGANGTARVHMVGSRVFASAANDAFRVDTTGNTNLSGIVVDIEDSEFSNGTNGIVVVTPVGANSAIVNVNDSSIFNNPGNALSVNGANSVIRISGSTITTNGAATQILGGGAISSFGDNRTVGNSTAPAFTPPTLTRN